MGFKLNAYNPCIVNYTVNETQKTVCWHADDTKVSHIDLEVNEQFSRNIIKLYDNNVTINRSDNHNYLGINFDFLPANET